MSYAVDPQDAGAETEGFAGKAHRCKKRLMYRNDQETNRKDTACTQVNKALCSLIRGIKLTRTDTFTDKDGSMKFIYLKDEIGGFAYHLVK